MKTSFFEMNVAMTGIFVAKSGLSVTSHNIANSTTKGYSRQIALQRTSTPLSLYTGKGMVGTGAEVYGIGQVRSFYLDQRYWGKNCTLGEYEVKRQALTMTETIFDPLSETGINAMFNDFFDTLQDLTTYADDETYRGNVLQTAQTLATYINSTYENLSEQQSDINVEFAATVGVINSIGTQIKKLNDQIVKYEFGGDSANDLRDQRALLVDELSRYVNIDVTNEDNEFRVQINGNDFVKGSYIRTLELQMRTERDNPDDVVGLYDLCWSGSGAKFDIYSPSLGGELRALVDMRDGNNGDSFKGTAIELNANFELTVENYSKTDILQRGKISLPDPRTGLNVDFTYDSFTVNDDGTITFKLTDLSSEDYAKFSAALPRTATSADTSDFKGIPYYLQRLNDMARTFARAINEGVDYKGDPIPGVIGHVYGYDQNDENKGYMLFTYTGSDGNQITTGPLDNYNGLTARNLTVSDLLKKNPEYLAASSKSDSGVSNNEVILGFSNIKNYNSLFREGKLEDYSTTIATEIGIDLKQANHFVKSYTDIVSAVDNQRLSVMSVDVDEETLNMVRYEQLYQAAAKLISVMDGLYDNLINRLGA